MQVNSLALGGTQLNAVDFAHTVEKYGFDSVLIGPRDTIPDGPSLFEVAEERGVRLQAFDRATSVLEGAKYLSGLAKEIDADIVHVYGAWAARSAYLGPCRLGTRPLVLTDYEMALSPDTFTAPQLIVGTGYLLDEQKDRFGPTTKISPPVDLSRDDRQAVDGAGFRAEFGIADTEIAVVLVGRLDATMKALSVELAISAMEKAGRDDLVLVLVGTGDSEERLRSLGAAVNDTLGRRAVIFTGARADPRSAYAAADISLGMGGSAARSLAFGTPLVVQGERGWSRIFTPETADALYRNSFWSDESLPLPADILADQLRELAADPAHRRELGTFGRVFARDHFGLEEMSRQLADCYADSMKNYGLREWMHDIDFELRAVAFRLSGKRSASDDGPPSAYRYRP
ncbi:hypothetical protein BH09ACT2_BH09ACT2_09260 [soil metagenome]